MSAALELTMGAGKYVRAVLSVGVGLSAGAAMSEALRPAPQ